MDFIFEARRLLPRFQAAYDSLSHSKNGADCGQHIMEDVDKCLKAIGNPHVPLLPINRLAPCVCLFMICVLIDV